MDLHPYISWNIRGASSNTKRFLIRNLIKSERPAICCLQETKFGNWSASSIYSLGLGTNIGWTFSPSKGLSGGLLTFWNPDLIAVTFQKCMHNWILICGSNKMDNTTFAYFNVYAPQATRDKQQLWAEILETKNRLTEESIILMGDFNSVRHQSERQNCKVNPLDTDLLNDFVSASHLQDIPLLNSSYTWYGPSIKRSRLDRILISTEWFRKGDWVLLALNRRTSDHKPICLKNMIQDWGPKPFKFFKCWLQNQGLISKLTASWKQSKTKNLNVRFKRFREQARKWNSSELGNIDLKIKEAECRQLVINEASSPTSIVSAGIGELDNLYSIKSSMLCQKARMNWHLQGERNTRLFHKSIAKRRAHNTIRRIAVGDGFTTKPSEIKDLFLAYFQGYLAPAPLVPIFALPQQCVKQILRCEADDLVKDFSMAEIELALASTDKYKSPGPDGINAGVLTALWPSIKEDILQFFNDFHVSGSIPQGYNSSFIALIPKVINPSSPAHYRLISLMNALIKLLSKVLAARLKKLMAKLIAPNQSAFVKGRQITESIFLANEVVSALQTKKAVGVILKIDFEKAFDRIQWDFVYEVFTLMKFDPKWVHWIRSIFESSNISVLINGTPTQEFTPNRGFRQGDPLSPLIFNLVVEILSSLINIATNLNLFSGILIPNCSVRLTHLQFADDTLMFLDGGTSCFMGAKRVLECFQLLSGMKINFSKSTLHGYNLSDSCMNYGAGLLGCKVGSVYFKYLGAVVKKSPRSINFWKPLVDKIRLKLEAFEAEHISIAGRIVLLKAVLDSIPIYWLNLYKIPVAVINSIERLRRDFFWGHSNGKPKKIHLLHWDRVCASKQHGGHGLSRIKWRNLALLSKWWWRAYSERDSYWNNILKQRYGGA